MSAKYQEVKASIDPTLKARLYAALESKNIPISDFIRSAAIALIETGEVPFEIKTANPGRPYVFKQVAEVEA
jgi:antitoxin component of RelBE/YafQ-DinJ toxin-antitoxin module